MEKNTKHVRYRTVLGCPSHGTVNGKETTILRRQNETVEQIRGYRCDACQRVYLEPSDGKIGPTTTVIKGYRVYFIKGPVKIPEQVYIYNTADSSGLCSCKGNKRKAPVFLLYDGRTADIVGSRICSVCHRVYVPMETYNRMSRFFSAYGIIVNMPANDSGAVKNLKPKDNTVKNKDVAIPKTVYVYDKETNEGVCSCPGTVNIKTRMISNFVLKDGRKESIPARECTNCHKVFITSGTYNNRRVFFEKTGIEIVIPFSGEPNTVETGLLTEKTVIPNNYTGGWEECIYSSDDYQESVIDFHELRPANRIASAYYDADIIFNPFQYLPWLKVYINGSRNLLISDEVGLGKTIEAGILIYEELVSNSAAKVIVLCPAFIREKWNNELKEKFDLFSQVYDGKTPIDMSTKIVILPISRINQYLEKESMFAYSMVIVDEIHYFKNSGSARYNYLSNLLSRIGNVKKIFMSATPVNNSGNDYYSVEKLFGSKPDRTNTTKKQAYIYLPERIIEDINVELTPEEQDYYDATDALDPFSGTIYRHIGSSCLYALSKYACPKEGMSSETKEELNDSIELLSEGQPWEDKDDVFREILKGKTVPRTDSKVNRLKEIIGSFDKGSKIVIFSHYIETVKYLHSELSFEVESGYIYANNISSNIPCRNIKNKFIDAKDWFTQESEKTKVLICSDACREGIDLDIANVLINYDLPFNPSILEQRIGRIDRMSQKNDMHIFNFHVNGTYDDRLHFILMTKLRFIDFFADYGIGNPLNITSDDDHIINSFIRYFKLKNDATMSNDDFTVIRRIFHRIGIEIEKRENIGIKQMQNILLKNLNENKRLIENWFDEGELKTMTEQELIRQKEELEKLLNFPQKINHMIRLDEATIIHVAESANKDPEYRKGIHKLIKGYDEKLAEVEITGVPMRISPDDLKSDYHVVISETDDWRRSRMGQVIERLRKEGAMIYEL